MSKFPLGQDGRVAALEGVQSGDEFMRFESRWRMRYRRVRCSRVTAKQAVIGNVKYRISDARPLEKSTHDLGLMEIDVDRLAQSRRDDMRDKLQIVMWRDATDEQVEQVYRIMFPKEKAGEA